MRLQVCMVTTFLILELIFNFRLFLPDNLASSAPHQLVVLSLLRLWLGDVKRRIIRCYGYLLLAGAAPEASLT